MCAGPVMSSRHRTEALGREMRAFTRVFTEHVRRTSSIGGGAPPGMSMSSGPPPLT